MRHKIVLVGVVGLVSFALAGAFLTSVQDTGKALNAQTVGDISRASPSPATDAGDSSGTDDEVDEGAAEFINDKVRSTSAERPSAGSSVELTQERIDELIAETPNTLCGMPGFTEALTSGVGFNDRLRAAGLVADIPTVAADQLGTIGLVYCDSDHVSGHIAYLFLSKDEMTSVAISNDQGEADGRRIMAVERGIHDIQQWFNVIVTGGQSAYNSNFVDTTSAIATSTTVDIDTLLQRK